MPWFYVEIVGFFYNLWFVNLFFPFLRGNFLDRHRDGTSSGTDDVHDILRDGFRQVGFSFSDRPGYIFTDTWGMMFPFDSWNAKTLAAPALQGKLK